MKRRQSLKHLRNLKNIRMIEGSRVQGEVATHEIEEVNVVFISHDKKLELRE